MTLDEALAAQRRLVDALRSPGRYPHPVSGVSVIETHISFVLLTGAFAYKIKKAVDLSFVDYTSLEQRRLFCSEELRLNRRLAPRLYLDVIEIGGTPEGPSLGQGDAPIEYAVKMAQFSLHDLLDRVLAEGRLTPGHVDALAAMVACFHAALPPATPEQPFGSPAAIREPMAANFEHLRSILGCDEPRLARLDKWSQTEFERLRDHFAARKTAGFVRECHGDLHLGNMALVDGEPLVFDCIEFNPTLRWIDVVSDLAFLVMDLSERGRPDYAWRVLNDWLQCLGDHGGLELLRFYQVYRALVRAKVAAIRAGDESLTAAAREAALAAAQRYLDYAQAVTKPQPGAILITHGRSGSGKSTLAGKVAQTLGMVQLRSDVERKRLHCLPPLARSGSGPGAGLYVEAATAATYERLATLAATVAAAGYPVVIDAACLCRWQRQRFRDLAAEMDLPFLILDCRAPPAVLRQRVNGRADAGIDASEATVAVLERQIATAEPLDENELAAAVAIDTAIERPEQALLRIRQRLDDMS